MIEIRPVRGIGEVRPGADLAGVIAAAAPWLRDGDVLVVTSKIVSKAEGRLVPVPEQGAERERARQQAIAAESARVVASRGPTSIVATHHGFVMAAAGIDTSNVETSQLALLPKDPDASARELRAALAERHGVRTAVIISDTTGRPWRNGLTDIALGAAGLAPLLDHRGQRDPYGNELQLTEMAVVDELAAAAELVKGKAEQVPVAVVRGLPVMLDEDGPGVVAALVRDAAADMFSLGTAEARAAGLREAAFLPDVAPPHSGSADPAALERAMTSMRPHVAPSTRMLVEKTGESVAVRATADPSDPAALVRLGADIHRLRAALLAEGLGSTMAFLAPGRILVRLGRPAT